MPATKPSNPLKGVEGYRRLARLVVRIFYGGDIPPPVADAPTEDTRGPINKPRPPHSKHSFAGLGVLLIDYLSSSRVDGYAKEADISADLRLSQKNVRKALRFLEAEHLVSSETVKFAFKRRNAEIVDDPELEERKRHETHVFWCIDYPRLLDALRLRLHKTKEILKQHATGEDMVQEYVCPRCGAQYSSLNAMSLLDMQTGTFRCEECRTELTEKVEGPLMSAPGVVSTRAGSSTATGITRKDRQTYFKDLLRRFETQTTPLLDQLEVLKDTSPPDYGTLQDWFQTKREEAALRAKRLESARKKVAAGSGGVTELTEEQLMEWADQTEVVVALPGSEEGGGLGVEMEAAGPRELPVWFRSVQRVEVDQETSLTAQEETTSIAGGHIANGSAASASVIGAEEERRQLEQQYLEQYLKQIGAAAHGGTFKIEEDVKGGIEVKGEDQKLLLQQQPKQEPGAEDVIMWEDAGGVGPGAQGAADHPDVDGDLAWEDA